MQKKANEGTLYELVKEFGSAEDMATYKAFKRAYEEKYKALDPYPNSIAVRWSWEDVQGQRPDLTKRQCQKVLANIYHNHDAGTGINWDVIDCQAAMDYPEKE